MIDLKLVQKQPEVLAKALADRHSELDVNEFLGLDARRRSLLAEVEALKSRRNAASGQVAALKREGQDAGPLLAELGGLSDRIKELDGQTAQAKADVEAWLMRAPNIPDASVPVGRDETENVEVTRWGTPRRFDFPVREHADLGVALGGLDFERAARLTGSRFVVSLGWAARLDRALVNFFLDQHTRHEGYIEVCPPYMVNRATMTGTGQLPKFEEDAYKVDKDTFLIPTAEVPVTNMYREMILDGAQLPIRHCAYSTCFRAEAGSAGRDTRGLIRQHQFNKVEMVKITKPEQSYDELESMTAEAEKVLQMLGLPYRVVTLCTGDMGFSAAKTYDIEVWLPSYNDYKEISSCSNCGDFQARRANIKYRDPENFKGSRFLHTLNGSGLPAGRTMAAILENFQQPDGTIRVPDVLVPYMGGVEVIGPQA